MSPHPRGTCSLCGEDVAVSARGTALAHGRKAAPGMGIDGKPMRTCTYGCRGWGMPVRETPKAPSVSQGPSD